MAAHAIDALRIEASSAPALLRACFGRTLLGPGIAVGPDLAFWARALRFAATLVVMQQYVPGIEVQRHGASENVSARWRPRLAYSERAQLVALAAAMPGACRALTLAERGMPSVAARELIDRFVEEMVEELVRSPAEPARAVAHRTGGVLHDRWVRALCSSGGVVGVSNAAGVMRGPVK